MKKLLIAVVLTGTMAGSVALAVPSSGSAMPSGGWIQGWQNGSSYSDGGQFTARVNGDPATDFQTFCIEIFNEFSPGSHYQYTMGQTTHDNPSGASPLKLGTAWLFSQFASGGFGGTEIGGQYFLTSGQAGELQTALWYFQSQGANPNGAFVGWGNGAPGSDSYTDSAITALGANAYTDSNGAYGVSVIEVKNGQDWLYAGAVPDGGMTVMLLGGALVGLGALRRKLFV